jgi:protein-S-isoprenylcysteine O-methyltransferase Ste14
MIPYFFLTGIRINKEEKYLSSGRAYNVYKEKVPFKLLPFVY